MGQSEWQPDPATRGPGSAMICVQKGGGTSIWQRAWMTTMEAPQKAACSEVVLSVWVRAQWAKRGTQTRWQTLRDLLLKGLHCPSFELQNRNFKGFKKCEIRVKSIATLPLHPRMSEMAAPTETGRLLVAFLRLAEHSLHHNRTVYTREGIQTRSSSRTCSIAPDISTFELARAFNF